MRNHQLTNPLLSMTATIIMCALLSACQNTNPSSKHLSEISSVPSNDTPISDNHHVHIHGDRDNRVYFVDGKEFTVDQLSEEQKKQINAIHQKMNQLEGAFEVDSDRMEEWGKKIEQVAEELEIEAEKLEGAMNSLEFDGHTHSMDEFSEKMEKASQNLEVKMQALEKQMHAMEIKMPKIDQKTMSEIEEQTNKLEKLLIEVADSI